MPELAGHFVAKNPAFEALHPRDRSGHDRGQFVDVPNLFAALKGIWDENRGVWMIPKSNRSDLDKSLADIGFDAINVPEGMRPVRPEDYQERFGPKTKIPPGWTDVFVNDDPDAPVQVLGRDSEGRQQRIQSIAAIEAGASSKFARIRALDRVMPDVDKALSDQAMTSDTAAVAMLVRKMGVRPGKRAKLGRVQAYGATTLERRHVKVVGDRVQLDFIGKEGVRNQLELEDAELAKVLKRRMRGKTGDQRLWTVNDRRLNRWVNENVGSDFTVKDFRTRLGTAEAKQFLSQFDPPTSKREARLLELRAGDHVSAILGNTRKQALESYIDPSVFPWSDEKGMNPEDVAVGMRVEHAYFGMGNVVGEVGPPRLGATEKVLVDFDTMGKVDTGVGTIEPFQIIDDPRDLPDLNLPDGLQVGGRFVHSGTGKRGAVLGFLRHDEKSGRDLFRIRWDNGREATRDLGELVGEDPAETAALTQARDVPWSRGARILTHQHAVDAGQFRHDQFFDRPEVHDHLKRVDELTKELKDREDALPHDPGFEERMNWTRERRSAFFDEKRVIRDLTERRDAARRDAHEARLRILKQELRRRRTLAPSGSIGFHHSKNHGAGTSADRQVAKFVDKAATYLPKSWIENVDRDGDGIEIKHSSGRGGWNGHFGKITAGTRGVAMHELGHAVEEHNPELGGVIREFFRERTAGHELESISSWLPSEKGFVNAFPERYTGRVYNDGNTEVLSMGLETLFYPPDHREPIWDKDPEYRNFILGLLFDHARTDEELDLDRNADVPEPNLPTTSGMGHSGQLRVLIDKREQDATLIRYSSDGTKAHVSYGNGKKRWIPVDRIVGGKSPDQAPATVEPTKPEPSLAPLTPLELDAAVQQRLAEEANLDKKNKLYKQYRDWTKTGHKGPLIRQIERSPASRPDAPEPPKAFSGNPKPPEAPGARPGAASREELAKAFHTGYEEGDELTGGASGGSVKRVTLSDGRMGVLKKPPTLDEHRREIASGVVAQALGLDVPAVDVGDGRLLTHFHQGRSGYMHMGDVLFVPGNDTSEDQFATLPGGREVGILDWLIRNRDRHDENWRVGDDGRVTPIDHGLTFFSTEGADRDVPRSRFATYWLGLTQKPTGRPARGRPHADAAKVNGPKVKLTPKVSKAYVNELRQRLQRGRAEFTDSEWTSLIARLDLLEAAAPDTIDGEAPMEAMT
jgi:DNA topoisomerase-1